MARCKPSVHTAQGGEATKDSKNLRTDHPVTAAYYNRAMNIYFPEGKDLRTAAMLHDREP